METAPSEESKPKKLNDELVKFARKASGPEVSRYTTKLKTVLHVQQKHHKADNARENVQTGRRPKREKKERKGSPAPATKKRGDDDIKEKRQSDSVERNSHIESRSAVPRTRSCSNASDPEEGCGKKRRKKSCGRKKRKRSCKKKKRKKSCKKKRKRKRSCKKKKKRRKSCKKKKKKKKCGKKKKRRKSCKKKC